VTARPGVEHLSGVRFSVSYSLAGDEEQARAKAADICYEQTVELPEDLTPEGDIRDHVVGRIEDLLPAGPGRYRATISYAVETAGSDLVQLLNVVYGNISIKPGIKVERLMLPEPMLGRYRGPRFGKDGWRRLLEVSHRPLICTALKPMGLSAAELADQAYRFARGGIDIVKDDHGLADQVFCPFDERVPRCADAVRRANAQTGRKSIYMPHVSGPADRVLALAERARSYGAGALLVCPGLVGLDALRWLAGTDSIALPVMAHPSLSGSLVISPDTGFSHRAWYGQLMRLAGADATVFPNYGGRFSFSRAECADIASGCEMPMGSIRAIFPAPGGGMTTDRARDMLEVYGREFILLIGGGLHRRGGDLAENSRRFVAMLESM
jgi:ribulose-bisphosphate carboxylase large chain